MAKVVSTKFGDRLLVHLPPVDIAQTKTPNVATIAPIYRSTAPQYISTAPQYRSMSRINGSTYSGARSSKTEAIRHKYYAYRDSNNQGNPEHRSAWTTRSEGNLVTNTARPQGHSNELHYSRLFEQGRVPTLQNYGQGQYPVIPPIGVSPYYTHYTPAGQASQPQVYGQQAGNHGYSNTLQPVSQSLPVSNPNERHIYYGPDGQILSAPPSHLQAAHTRKKIPDFDIRGRLLHGRLTSIQVLDVAKGFPKIPDFLNRDLLEKYAHYPETDVRIMVKSGQVHVYATPILRQHPPPPFIPPLKPQFVPVYLDEDEEFDNDKFLRGYYSKNPKYGINVRQSQQSHQSPPVLQSLYSENDDRW